MAPLRQLLMLALPLALQPQPTCASTGAAAARCLAIPRGCGGGTEQEWFVDATDALELGATGGVRSGTGDCPPEYENSSAVTCACQATRQELLADSDPARLERAEARAGCANPRNLVCLWFLGLFF